MLNEIKKHITKPRLIGAGIILILIIIISSCGGAEKTVKNGSLKLNPNITIKEAFNNYAFFKKVKWESFKDSEGRQCVQMTGTFDMKKMFILNYQGETFNFLEGFAFENILASYLDGARFNSCETDGNWEELDTMLNEKYDFRSYALMNLIESFESDPDYVIANAKNYIENWDSQYDIEKTEAHKDIVQHFANGDYEGGMKSFNDASGTLSTDFKKNSGSYRIQFLVEGKKSFRVYYAETSVTFSVVGASGPVTFTMKENDNFPYLRKVYDNSRFFE